MNTVEDQTPSLQNVYDDFLNFLEKSRPPPASLKQFFGYLTFKKPAPEFLSISKINTANFTSYFNNLKENILKEINSKKNEISHLEDHFDSNPPFILDNFNQFSESHKQNTINYFQLYTELYRLLSTLSINRQILELESRNSSSRKNI